MNLDIFAVNPAAELPEEIAQELAVGGHKDPRSTPFGWTEVNPGIAYAVLHDAWLYGRKNGYIIFRDRPCIQMYQHEAFAPLCLVVLRSVVDLKNVTQYLICNYIPGEERWVLLKKEGDAPAILIQKNSFNSLYAPVLLKASTTKAELSNQEKYLLQVWFTPGLERHDFVAQLPNIYRPRSISLIEFLYKIDSQGGLKPNGKGAPHIYHVINSIREEADKVLLPLWDSEKGYLKDVVLQTISRDTALSMLLRRSDKVILPSERRKYEYPTHKLVYLQSYLYPDSEWVQVTPELWDNLGASGVVVVSAYGIGKTSRLTERKHVASRVYVPLKRLHKCLQNTVVARLYHPQKGEYYKCAVNFVTTEEEPRKLQVALTQSCKRSRRSITGFTLKVRHKAVVNLAVPDPMCPRCKGTGSFYCHDSRRNYNCCCSKSVMTLNKMFLSAIIKWNAEHGIE